MKYIVDKGHAAAGLIDAAELIKPPCYDQYNNLPYYMRVTNYRNWVPVECKYSPTLKRDVYTPLNAATGEEANQFDPTTWTNFKAALETSAS